MVLFSSTIGDVLWVMLVASLIMPYASKCRKQRRTLREEQQMSIKEGGEA